MRKLVRFTYNQFKESLIEKKRFKFYYGKRFDVKNYFTIYLLVSSFFIRILSRILFLFVAITNFLMGKPIFFAT